MAEDWTGIAAEALAAIADLGFDVILTRDGAQDAPWQAALDAQPYVIRVIDGQPWRAYQPATNVTQTGRTLMMGANGFVPLNGDSVTIDDREHSVMRVRKLSPGGVDLLYYLEMNA